MSKRKWIVNVAAKPRARDIEVAATTPEDAVRRALSLMDEARWDAQWVEDMESEEAHDVISMCELSGKDSPNDCRQVVLSETDYHSIEDGGYLCEACSKMVTAEAAGEAP